MGNIRRPHPGDFTDLSRRKSANYRTKEGKQEVKQYEKEIQERGAAVISQERTKAEKEKTKTKKK